MVFNTFRLVSMAIVGLIAWFAFFSEQSNDSRRRAPLNNVKNMCKTPGHIGLTFDEGPGEITPAILDQLAKQNITATFHVKTEWISQAAVISNLEEISKRHVVGLRYPNKAKAVKDESDTEIIKTLLAESGAIYTIIKQHPRFLRFPYGKFDQRAVDIAGKMGFVVTEANIDSGDYLEGASRQSISAKYNEQLSLVMPGAGRYIALHNDGAKIYRQDNGLMAYIDGFLKPLSYKLVNLAECIDVPPYRDQNVPPPGSGVEVPPAGGVGNTSDADPLELSLIAMVSGILVWFGF